MHYFGQESGKIVALHFWLEKRPNLQLRGAIRKNGWSKNKQGNDTPMDIARKNGEWVVYEFETQTPLLVTIECGRIKGFQNISDEKFDQIDFDKNGKSLLHYAAVDCGSGQSYFVPKLMQTNKFTQEQLDDCNNGVVWKTKYKPWKPKAQN